MNTSVQARLKQRKRKGDLPGKRRDGGVHAVLHVQHLHGVVVGFQPLEKASVVLGQLSTLTHKIKKKVRSGGEAKTGTAGVS